MSLLERVRATGTCPPSLLKKESSDGDQSFEEVALRILDSNGTSVVDSLLCTRTYSLYGVYVCCVSGWLLTILVLLIFIHRTFSFSRWKFGGFQETLTGKLNGTERYRERERRMNQESSGENKIPLAARVWIRATRRVSETRLGLHWRFDAYELRMGAIPQGSSREWAAYVHRRSSRDLNAVCANTTRSC